MRDERKFGYGNLVSRLRKLEEGSKIPRSDIWSRVNIFLPFITAVAVAALAFFLPNIFNQKYLQIQSHDEHILKQSQEIEIVEKFFPHLTSKNEEEKKAAIEVISRLDDKELALKIAAIFGGPGGTGAAINIGATSSGSDRETAESAITELYSKYGNSIGHLSVIFSDGGKSLIGTCLLIDSNGTAVTAASYFPSDRKVSQITVSLGSKLSEEIPASLVNLKKDEGVAILKVGDMGKFSAAKIAENSLEPGTPVVIMGFTKIGDLPVSKLSIVQSRYNSRGQVLLSTQHVLGLAGAPLFNADGIVIGIVTGSSVKGGQSVAAPIPSATTPNDSRS
jgi:hypothetical protein